MAAEDNVDLIVLKTFFPGRNDGVLVEVGAAHPEYLSISASFRQRGWKIIAVEPNPDFCAIHKQYGFEVLEYACSDEDRDGVDFTVVDSHGVDYLGGKVSAESISSLGIKDEFAILSSVWRGVQRPRRFRSRSGSLILFADACARGDKCKCRVRRC